MYNQIREADFDSYSTHLSIPTPKICCRNRTDTKSTRKVVSRSTDIGTEVDSVPVVVCSILYPAWGVVSLSALQEDKLQEAEEEAAEVEI